MGSLPTWPTTLQRFVSLALQPNTCREDLIAIVELDPGLMLAALSLVPAGKPNQPWHAGLDAPLLRALAVIQGNRQLVHPEINLPPGSGNAGPGGGMAARYALLAGALGEDGNARLAGLFAGAALDWAIDLDAFANYLAQFPLPPDVRDGVRFSNVPLEQLAGLSRPIRETAAAGALLPCLEQGGDLPAWLLESVTALLGIDSEQVYTALGSATRQLQGLSKPADEPLANLLLNANMSNALYRARAGDSRPLAAATREITRLMLAGDRVYLFVARSGTLCCEADDYSVRIDMTRTTSAVALAASQGQPVTRDATGAIDVIDRQLIDRLGGECLLVIPLAAGAGLIACGVPRSVRDSLLASGGRLAAFTDLVTSLYLTEPEAETGQPGTVSLDDIDRQLREITHEVNNPLTTVRNYVASLSMKLGTDGPVGQELRAISSELARVGRIVQKYARVGREEELTFEVIDLNNLIGDLVAVVAEGSTIRFTCEFDLTLPPLEFAADALRQVVLNLLRNATEALAGTIDAEVIISTQGAINVGGHAYTEVTVTDNGPGMTAAVRLALFDPNPDDNAGMTTKGEGRGLGLSIVRQLMTAMNGIVSCREGPGGQGTRFQLLIPIGAEAHHFGNQTRED
ncbi:MAG: sensor histidine kinase [Pseudomonadota bacterium]